MKIKCLLLTIGIGYSMLLPAHSQIVTVLRDDFEDGVVHPDWVVSTTNTVNPVYAEQGGSLQVITIPPKQVGADEWCTLQFSRSFLPVSDFDASFDIGWDSTGANSAMQALNVVLYDALGSAVATARYYDGSVTLPGNLYAAAGGSNGTPVSVPLAGTTSIRVTRTSDALTVSFDSNLKVTANVKSPVVKVGIVFEHYTYSGGSTFGRLSVRDVNVAGKLDGSAITPHVAAELEWLGAIGKTYAIVASGDLETWIPIETGIPGDNKIIYRLISTRTLREQHGWKNVFFRNVVHSN
jgi:hypothetical protein